MSRSKVEVERRCYPAGLVRELDRVAIEEQGIPGIELMHRAGRAVWDELVKVWPRARNVLVVCGAGNNAGDGYVIAQCITMARLNVNVVALTPIDNLTGDARKAADEYLTSGNQVVDSFNKAGIEQVDVIVDAILGTGLDREVSGEFRKTIDQINQSGIPVISVDIPSGLNADTGTVMGAAVRADHTVTFIGQKQGMYTGEAVEYCGAVTFTDLNVPPEIYASVEESANLVDTSVYSHLLSSRTRTGHKGDYGHVLVIGGDYGFAGAVRLSGEAAARTGAGLVSIATRPEHAYALPASCPELMAAGITNPGDVLPLLKKATVVALGPGLGQSEWSVSLLSSVLDSDLPMVIDADALNLLAKDPVKRDNWVLTPHPGEAARLLNITASEVQSDRFAAVNALLDTYGGVIVLKGPGTIIAASSAGKLVCTQGNPGMATGGMGDILTGIIAGLMAQTNDNVSAAAAAVCIHAHAGDLCAAQGGERGMMATDLLAYIRQLVNPA